MRDEVRLRTGALTTDQLGTDANLTSLINSALRWITMQHPNGWPWLRGEFPLATVAGTEDYDFNAHRELVPMQPGDVPVTFADAAALEADYGFRPAIGIREGLRRFVEWYATYRERD